MIATQKIQGITEALQEFDYEDVWYQLDERDRDFTSSLISDCFDFLVLTEEGCFLFACNEQTGGWELHALGSPVYGALGLADETLLELQHEFPGVFFDRDSSASNNFTKWFGDRIERQIVLIEQ